MSKARDLANAGTALTTVSATELGYVDGVTSAIQTQIDSKEATLPSQTGNSGKYLTTDGSTKSWGTVSQYALPSQTGNSGKFLTTNGTSESWGTVTQPITWTLRAVTTETIRKIAYNGSNLYVGVGAGGELYTSSDAITWTSRTSGFGTTDINSVAYGNGLWVAVGSSGTLRTSTDGITWTARTANMATEDINDVVYANSLWVAVGGGGGTSNSGGIIYSTDGITWTRKSQSLTVGSTYFSVIWNGTNWIVGADVSSGNNHLYASIPSGTWTAASTLSSTAIRKIFWDGTRHVFYNNAWYYSTSTSTLTGSVAYTGVGSIGTNVVWQSTLYNNTLYYGEIYWNTLPVASTSVVSLSSLEISPTVSQSSSTPFISGGLTGFFAGAAGLIVTGSRKIFTSF
jgi:hypothetical protein